MASKILVYDSWENHCEQDNLPKKGQIVKCKIKHTNNNVYVKVKGFEHQKNGVSQLIPISRFREPTFGELVTFKISHESKAI